MAAVYYAMHHLQLPLVVFWDLLHQGVNEVLGALQDSGVWPAVLELLLVFRLPYGPWAGQKFWRDLQDAAALASQDCLADSAHFQSWLGERLLEETGGRAPLSNVWDRKGVRATLGRWFSWWWANKDLRQVWWSKLSTLFFALTLSKKMPPASVFADLVAVASRAGSNLKQLEAASAQQRSRKRKRKKAAEPAAAEPGAESHPLAEDEEQKKKKKTCAR